ncbi:MAG: CDP-alcohol phosphatidyltransferase family protein [Clostridia bacterium]|nr:CDP-alcohol phosphatidyltransferase family protein [Clostridia bacterium]
MLDTHGRKYVDRLFDRSAAVFLKCHMTPTQVTLVALVLGVCAGIAYYFDQPLYSIGLLWTSGYLDAVDGAMARKSNATSATGTLLDIFFDRVVELVFILSFALKHETAIFALLTLTCTIVLSMSIFLTSGMLIENSGKKSFHYQAGLMERTEGFIMFTLMMTLNFYMREIAFLYAGLILVTVVQRLRESIRILGDSRTL